MFLKISQNSQENTYVRVSFWTSCRRKKKRTLAQVFYFNDVRLSLFHELSKVDYFSLPNRRDVTAIIFLIIFHPQLCYFSHTFIKNGPNFAPLRLFQAPCLLKSRNQVVQLPPTPLFQPPHQSKLEHVFDFHIKVKIKLLNAHEHSIASHSKLWLMHATVFKRESQTNNEHTVAVLCQKHDFILFHHFFEFFVF